MYLLKKAKYFQHNHPHCRCESKKHFHDSNGLVSPLVPPLSRHTLWKLREICYNPKISMIFLSCETTGAKVSYLHYLRSSLPAVDVLRLHWCSEKRDSLTPTKRSTISPSSKSVIPVGELISLNTVGFKQSTSNPIRRWFWNFWSNPIHAIPESNWDLWLQNYEGIERYTRAIRILANQLVHKGWRAVDSNLTINWNFRIGDLGFLPFSLSWSQIQWLLVMIQLTKGTRKQKKKTNYDRTHGNFKLNM